MGVEPRAPEAVVRPVAGWMPDVLERRRGEFRCPMVASGGLCKTLWLKKQLSFLCG